MQVPTAPLLGMDVSRPAGNSWHRGTIVGIATTIGPIGADRIPTLVVRFPLVGEHTVDRVVHPATLAIVVTG